MIENRDISSSLNLGFILKLALRDGYAGRGKLLLLISSVILGIAAIVSIQLFSLSLKVNIDEQSQGLLGADYVIKSRQKFTERTRDIVDSLDAEKSSGSNFASMVSFPKTKKSRLVNIRAIEGDFPYYGQMRTIPADAISTYQKEETVLVDETVMLQFNLRPGDSIKVGELTFAIAGSVTEVPGQSGIAATVAPPVFIPFRILDKTGLLEKGSRIDYEFYFKNIRNDDLAKLKSELEPLLDPEGAEIETHVSIANRTTKSYSNFLLFLNIVAFSALLLGCIGVFSSVNIYLKGKIKSIAMLRCLGVTKLQSFLIYLFQIIFLGFAGGIIGSLAGLGIQAVLPILLQDFLPLDIRTIISYDVLISGIVAGLIVSVLFALIPLFSIWDLSPLRVLRVTDDKKSTLSYLREAVVIFIILIFIFLFSFIQINDAMKAGLYTAALLIILGCLSGFGWLLMFAVRKLFPAYWSFEARQSLLNLFRPNNQTLVLVISIGMGCFLISTLYFTKDILLNKISLETGDEEPNLIIFDIQNEQLSTLKATLKKQNVHMVAHVPMVNMKLHSVKGRSISALRQDSTSGIKKWVLNREYRVTFRKNLTDSEKIIEGHWVGSHTDQDKELIPISLEEKYANDINVSIGDKMEFNVQGIIMATQVASIRKVDWQRMQTNFIVLFPDGVLNDAPQFHVITSRIPDQKSSSQLQQMLVLSYPGLSIVDLRQALVALEGILDKISRVIAFMAFFSIGTGFIVLIGAVKVTRFQRIEESVLLRTMGASRKQIFKITALEYFYLGCFSSLTGILLSYISSAIIAYYSFDTMFVPSVWPSFIIFILITGTCMLVGVSNSFAAISRPPLEVLRKES